MLDPRAQHLLKTLVERYIAEGEPVGSRALSKYSSLELSPATVRNVMADLEEMGFIASPHTSSGRIPTPKGYRFFVDSLVVVQALEQVEIHRLEERLTSTGRPAELVSAAAQILSQLTQFAGVVGTPKLRGASFRHLEFLRLSDRRVLLIIVAPDGDVQNRILHTERSYTQLELAEATTLFNQQFAGRPFHEVRGRLASELNQLREDIAQLMSAAVEAGEGAMTENDGVVVAGERNLLSGDLLHSVDRLKQLFDVFEKKTSLIHLLDVSQQSHGVQIYIGGESGLVPLDEMSVVTAPYEIDGRVIGTLGVIGPTRMAYERIIPIVEMTAKLLSNALDKQLTD